MRRILRPVRNLMLGLWDGHFRMLLGISSLRWVIGDQITWGPTAAWSGCVVGYPLIVYDGIASQLVYTMSPVVVYVAIHFA